MSERIIKFKNDSIGSMSLKSVEIIPNEIPIKPVYNIDLPELDTWSRYVNYYGDLSAAFDESTGRTKSQWGKEHYKNHGRTKGRYLPGKLDLRGYIGHDAIKGAPDTGGYYDLKITKSLWDPMWYPIKGSDGKAMMLYHVGEKANFIWHRTFTDWIDEGSFNPNGPGVRAWTKHAIDFLTRNKSGSRKILVYENVVSTNVYSFKLQQDKGRNGAFEEILEGDEISYINVNGSASGVTEAEQALIDTEVLSDYDVIVIVGNNPNVAGENAISVNTLGDVSEFCKIEGKGVLFMGDHDAFARFPNYVSEHLFNEGILDKKIEYDGSASSAASNSPRFDDPQWQVFGDIFKDATGERYGYQGMPSLNGDFLGWEFDKKFIFEGNSPDTVYIEGYKGERYDKNNPTLPSGKLINGEAINTFAPVEARYIRLSELKGTPQWPGNGGGCLQMELYDTAGEALTRNLPTSNWTESDYWGDHPGWKASYSHTGVWAFDAKRCSTYPSNTSNCKRCPSTWAELDALDYCFTPGENWVQVDLGEIKDVHRIGTKGRESTKYNLQYVTSYCIQYSVNGTDWSYICTLDDVVDGDEEYLVRLAYDIKVRPDNTEYWQPTLRNLPITKDETGKWKKFTISATQWKSETFTQAWRNVRLVDDSGVEIEGIEWRNWTQYGWRTTDPTTYVAFPYHNGSNSWRSITVEVKLPTWSEMKNKYYNALIGAKHWTPGIYAEKPQLLLASCSENLRDGEVGTKGGSPGEAFLADEGITFKDGKVIYTNTTDTTKHIFLAYGQERVIWYDIDSEGTQTYSGENRARNNTNDVVSGGRVYNGANADPADIFWRTMTDWSLDNPKVSRVEDAAPEVEPALPEDHPKSLPLGPVDPGGRIALEFDDTSAYSGGNWGSGGKTAVFLYHSNYKYPETTGLKYEDSDGLAFINATVDVATLIRDDLWKTVTMDGEACGGLVSTKFPLTLTGLPEHSKVRIEISEDVSLFSITNALFDVDQPIVFNNKGYIYCDDTIIRTQHDIYYEQTGQFSGLLPTGVSSAESLRSYNFLQGKSFDIQTVRPDRTPEALPVTIASGREVDVLITPLNTTDDILYEDNAPNIVFKYDCPIGTDNEIVATRKLQSEIRNYVDYSKDNLYITIINRHQTVEDREYITLKKVFNNYDGSYVYRQQPDGGPYWEMSYTDDAGWMLKRLNGTNPCSYKYNPKDNEYSDVEYITLPIDLSYCLTGMGNTSDMTWSPVDVDPTDDTAGFIISHSLPEQPSIPSSARNKTGMYGLDILHRFDIDQDGGVIQLEWTEADNMKDLVYIIQYIPYTSAVENSKKYGYIVDPRSGSLAKTITLDVSSIDSFDESHIIDNQISITPVDLHTGELNRYRPLTSSGTLPGLNIVYDKDTETLTCGVMQSDITGNTAIKAHIESSESGLSRDFNMVFDLGNTAMHDRMSKQKSSNLNNARAIGYLDQNPLSYIHGTYTGLTAVDNGNISGPKDWSYCSEWTDIIEGPGGESYVVINTMNDHEDQPRASVDLRVVFQQSTYKGWVLSNGTGDASKTTLNLGAGLGVNQNGYTYDIPGTDYHFDPSNPDIEDNAGVGATKVNTHTYNTLNSSGKSNYIAIAIENPEGKASLVQVDIVDEKTKDYAPLTYDHYRGRSMTGILEEVWETKYRRILPGGIACMISVDGDRMESPGSYDGGVWKSTFDLAYVSNPTGKKQTRISIENLPKLKEQSDEFTISYSIGNITRRQQFSVDQLWLANNSTYCSNFAPGRPDPYALNESTATYAAMTNAGTALRTSKDHGNKWYDSDPFEKHGYWLQSGGLHGEEITYVDGKFTWEEARLDARNTGGELARILHTNQLDIVNSLGPKDGWLGALENEFVGGHHLGFGDRHWHGWSRKSAPGGGDRTGSYLYYWVSPSTSVKNRNHIHVPSDGSSNNYVIPIPAGAGQGIVRESIPVNYLEEMRAGGISAYAVGDLGLTTGYIRYANGKYNLFVREPEGYPPHTNIVMGGWLDVDNFQELETPEEVYAKYFLTFPDRDSDDQHSDNDIGSFRRFTSDQGTFLRTYAIDVPSTGGIEWIIIKKFYRTID